VLSLTSDVSTKNVAITDLETKLTEASEAQEAADERASSLESELSTAKAGDLGKQFATAAMDLIVTSDDCGTVNGIPVAVDDKDNDGFLTYKHTHIQIYTHTHTSQLMDDHDKDNDGFLTYTEWVTGGGY
jgi:hypothetical protein